LRPHPPPLQLPSRRAILLAALAIVAAVAVAYRHTLDVPFLFDDGLAITENPSIRSLAHALSPSSRNGAPVNGRPLLNFSFALNYAVGGKSVRGYHVTNLAIHALAALTLFGIVRRTLLQPKLRERFGAASLPLAFAIALLWALHPLQTESVTYLSQRAESLAALFVLLTLHAFIRSGHADDAGAANHSRSWLFLSGVACLAAMATKETAAAAPLLVFLYDRTFVSGSVLTAWRTRKPFYLMLAGTWLLLAALVWSASSRGGTAGFGAGVGVWEYALTQCRAIVLYLRLAIWPQPQVFDYGVEVVQRVTEILPQAVLLLALLAAAVATLKRNHPAGFLGLCFFALLAPSSSLVPVATQTIAEHRVYLPLASVVALVACGTYRFIGARAIFITTAAALACGFLTARRNDVYRTELSLWRDTVAQRPDNARALNNLGKALLEAGDIAGATAPLLRARELLPNYPETLNNLGFAFAHSGEAAEAVALFERSLALRPDNPRAHANFGDALLQLNRLPEAVAQFEAARALQPESADAHRGLGNALAESGRLRDAIGSYEQALRLDPNFAEAHSDLGAALAQSGNSDAALDHYREALRLKPRFPEAENNLGNLLFKAGRVPEALEHYRAALRTKPDYAEAGVNLGNALLETGRTADALPEYERALATAPDNVEARFGRANALAQLDRLPEAIEGFRATLQLKPDHVAARANLGNALLLLDRVPEAIGEYEAALRLAPNDEALRDNLAQARQLLRRNPPTRKP
jgi:protein O-mannosyl-transferase